MTELNVEGQAQAEATTKRIRKELFKIVRSGENGAVIGSAPAGGGKTHFVVETIAWLVERGLNVLVCTPTNKQVGELVERTLGADLNMTLLHARGKPLDLEHPNLEQVEQAGDINPTESVVVCTVSKAGFSGVGFDNIDLSFDVLILDEAYQVQSSTYLYVGDLAPAHLLVGDPGQLKPFSTLGDVDYWKGSSEDPLSTAVDVICRYHPETPNFQFPMTRRLDARGAAIAQPFYGDHSFSAWIPEGVRSMTLGPAGDESAEIDFTIQHAATRGWAYSQVPQPDEGHTPDQAIADRIAEVVATMLARVENLTDERGSGSIDPDRILVGVSTNSQRTLVINALRARGARGVHVLTANKAQGLEFDVTIVWHPLAGLKEVSAFTLDTGRLCVLMTRHRHAAIVVGVEGDQELVEGIPIDTPSHFHETDTTLLGWYAHQRLFSLLGSSLVPA